MAASKPSPLLRVFIAELVNPRKRFEPRVQLGLRLRKIGDGFLLSCSGKIVLGAESQALERMLSYLLNMSRRVVLDLREVRIMDCGGLGILVAKFVEAQKSGRSLEFCGVSAEVLTVLRATGLEKVITVQQTLSDSVCDDAVAERRCA